LVAAGVLVEIAGGFVGVSSGVFVPACATWFVPVAFWSASGGLILISPNRMAKGMPKIMANTETTRMIFPVRSMN
jgi:hypothetical protein